MKKITTIGLSMLLISFISSCTNSSKDAQLKDKKAQLEKLKSEQASIDSKIESLQKEIAVLDTGSAIIANPKLVALSTVQKR